MTASFAAVSQLVDALGHVPVVVGVLTKGSLLIIIAVALTRALAHAPAAARHLVWSLSVAALLLLPATSWMPWRLELPVLGTARDALGVAPVQPIANTAQPSDAGKVEAVSSDANALPSVTPAASDLATPDLTTTQPQAPTLMASVIERVGKPAALLIVLWLAGTLWMLGRLVIGIATVRSMIRRSIPAEGDGWDEILERARKSIGGRPIARTVISDYAAMPFTYGLLRPTIVLPSSSEEWTTDRRRSVLLHELAHVRRHDLITNAVVQFACAIYWFHPLVWLAARRVRIEAERACDALVVGTGTLPSEYAGDLLEIARTMRSSATAAVALAMARRSDFEGRLLAILAPNSGRNVLTAARAVFIAVSFAAPAAAVAAAVPPRLVTPNAVVTETKNTNADESNNTAGEHPNTVPHAAPVSKSEAALAAASQSGSEKPSTQGRDAAVPGLISVLKDESPAVRLASVEALSQLQDPRAIDALADVMKNDSDARVREAAASALGSIDSARAVPALIAALGSERVGAVRAKIAWALGEIDDPRAIDALSAAVKDQVTEVRHQAVWALGEIQSAEAVPALIPVLRDADAEMRKQAAEALGQIENADAIPALSVATKDANPEVREQAVWALGQIENVKALPALVAALSDDVVEVRRKAVEAIGDIDDLRTAPPGLIAALKDTDSEVRQNAAQALGNLEDKAAVPGLIPLTRDGNADVKRAAVEALSNIGGEAAIEAIVVLLKDSDPEIRKIAAEALGKNR